MTANQLLQCRQGAALFVEQLVFEPGCPFPVEQSNPPESMARSERPVACAVHHCTEMVALSNMGVILSMVSPAGRGMQRRPALYSCDSDAASKRSLPIHHEVQADNVSLPAYDLRRPATVKGERDRLSELHDRPGIAPYHGEGAKAGPPCRDIDPRRSSALMPVGQHHAGCPDDVFIHFTQTADRPVHVCCFLPVTAGAQCSGLFSPRAGVFPWCVKTIYRMPQKSLPRRGRSQLFSPKQNAGSAEAMSISPFIASRCSAESRRVRCARSAIAGVSFATSRRRCLSGSVNHTRRSTSANAGWRWSSAKSTA